MASNPYQQLYTFLDALKVVQKRGGGNLAIVPRNILSWRIETTKGGEADYLAWSQVDYNNQKLLWSQLGTASQKQLPWPLGNSFYVAAELDKLNPLNYKDEQIPVQQIFVILAQTATVDEAIKNINNGLKIMDPKYPIIRTINPIWVAGGIGVLLTTYFLVK